MTNDAFDRRVQDLKARAHGRWTSILAALGVDERILGGKNQPCPMCGGHDRFQYTDKFQEGNYHCRGCGAGGGLKLAQHVLGLPFGELVEKIERQFGVPHVVRLAASTDPSPERMKRLSQRIWDEARPVAASDEVDRYLAGRGLRMAAYPQALRFHPSLGYFEKQPGERSKKVGEFPAMLACVQGRDGQCITLHRTYLKDGRQAVGPQSKKVLSAGINGSAVRLFEPERELAITEGIETGLAVHLGTGKAVWAGLNCGNMEKLWIPESVERVCIYADNDAGFEGQACAFGLARRLVREARMGEAAGRHREVQVFVPRHCGADWADIWLNRLAGLRKAA